MKRFIKADAAIKSGTDVASTFTFSPNDLVQFLYQIPELNEYEISYSEDENGNLAFFIGNTVIEVSMK